MMYGGGPGRRRSREVSAAGLGRLGRAVCVPAAVLGDASYLDPGRRRVLPQELAERRNGRGRQGAFVGPGDHLALARGLSERFAARMDWTIQDLAHANHNPKVVVNGQGGSEPIQLEMKLGDTVTLDVAGTTDPDGNKLTYNWFVYLEAGLTGMNGADVEIAGNGDTAVQVTAKSSCRAAWLKGLVPCRGDGVVHVILAVSDDGQPRLTQYRRAIVTVKPAKSN